jgi:hypothetical protein
MAEHITVSEAARELAVAPRLISDLFYRRLLDDAAAPIVGGRRIIPRTYLDNIRAVLSQAGHLPEAEAVAHAS